MFLYNFLATVPPAKAEGPKLLRTDFHFTQINQQELAMTKTRVVVALLAVLTLPLALHAQYPPGGGDAGQYVIQSAQYGTAEHHVDVTGRLKELARQDRTFRLDNGLFGTDPDPGRVKTLRIYARGPNGQERVFEYREKSIIDGSLFRGWGSGEWGGGGWHGRWEGNGGGYEPQPEMTAALQHLREAQQNLEAASHDKGGHRAKAIEIINQAMREVQAGIDYDNRH